MTGVRSKSKGLLLKPFSHGLIRSHPVEFDLMLHVFAVSEGCVHEDDPIARHRERQRDAVFARFDLSRHAADRTHARVRHVTFRFDVRTTHGLLFRVEELQIDRRRADAQRLRAHFVLNRDVGLRSGSMTGRSEQRNEQ